MPEVKFRPGAHVRGVTADVLTSELERICEENGGQLSAPNVLEAATPEDSLLHAAFEWRDGIAAHEYRLGQARQMIRAVIVQPTPEELEAQERRSRPIWVHTSRDDYRQFEVVIRTPDLFAKALGDAVGRLESAEHSVRVLLEAATDRGDVKKGSAIRSVLKTLTTLRAELKRL